MVAAAQQQIRNQRFLLTQTRRRWPVWPQQAPALRRAALEPTSQRWNLQLGALRRLLRGLLLVEAAGYNNLIDVLHLPIAVAVRGFLPDVDADKNGAQLYSQ